MCIWHPWEIKLKQKKNGFNKWRKKVWPMGYQEANIFNMRMPEEETGKSKRNLFHEIITKTFLSWGRTWKCRFRKYCGFQIDQLQKIHSEAHYSSTVRSQRQKPKNTKRKTSSHVQRNAYRSKYKPLPKFTGQEKTGRDIQNIERKILSAKNITMEKTLLQNLGRNEIITTWETLSTLDQHFRNDLR